MVIAICTYSREEYEKLAGWIKEYGDANGMSIAVQWFESHEKYIRGYEKEPFPITFLSFDDIVNQELAVAIRGSSRAGEIVWLGEDKRFGISSYRVKAVNFMIKPVAREGVWDSMDRCMNKLRMIRRDGHGRAAEQ